ncbi:lipopolysaccharide biosynthesis protein [Actinotalea subterranea]|uniref:lipopolysaccharide biosynthesis protein n=1 Tax=Actinotalea subterranea TaxID=2607497 RepID=UPI0011EFBA2A|nr:lipopolysaccharide biosynthesis protein [Actinotalea subterranea]
MTTPSSVGPTAGPGGAPEAAPGGAPGGAPGDPTSAPLGARAARGAVVTIGGQAIRMVVQVVSVVLLARMLSPHDYGLVAMVLAVVGIGEIFRDFGLSSAAIQAKTLSRAQRDNLFWLNSGMGLLLSVLAFAAAGPLATLYGEPELVPVARALAVTFLLSGLATQYRADLNRHLRFALLAAVDVAAPVVGLAVALTFALLDAGYWALVAQQVSVALTLLVGAAIAARWVPRLPRRDADMRGLLRFGWNLLATQVIGYAGNNVDSLVIGLRFGAGPLGLYNRAFHLLMTPLSQLRSPTTTVALPVLSRLREEPARFDEFVRRGQLALGYTLVVGLGLVVAGADPLTDVLLGSQWTEVAPVIRLLAVAGVFQTLAYVGYWVYLACGLTDVLLRYTMVSVALKVACIVVGSQWGIVGAAAGYALAPALSWPLSLWWLSRHTRFPLRTLLLGAGRVLTLVALASGAGWLTAHLVGSGVAALDLLVTVGAAGVVHVAAWLTVPSVRRDVHDVALVARLARHRPTGVTNAAQRDTPDEDRS